MLMRELMLILHFLGLGLFVTVLVAGFILDVQYRRASDPQTKAIILKSLRPIGLLSPFALLVVIISGIGNMHAIGVGLLDFGWLTAKIIFVAIAAISGMLFGIKAQQRGQLVQQMAKGDTPPDAYAKLKTFDNQQRLFYAVNSILLLIILSLSVYGRLGGQ